MNKKYIGKCVCVDCGTGYGENGPLLIYELNNSEYFICQECDDIEEEKELEDIGDEPEMSVNQLLEERNK